MIRKPALDRSNIVYFAKYESNCNVIIQIKLNTILAFLKNGRRVQSKIFDEMFSVADLHNSASCC